MEQLHQNARRDIDNQKQSRVSNANQDANEEKSEDSEAQSERQLLQNAIVEAEKSRREMRRELEEMQHKLQQAHRELSEMRMAVSRDLARVFRQQTQNQSEVGLENPRLDGGVGYEEQIEVINKTHKLAEMQVHKRLASERQRQWALLQRRIAARRGATNSTPSPT